MNNSNNFIPYGKQNISEDDIKAVVDVLKSDYLTQGPSIELFEKKISSKLESQFTVAVNSATSALHIACLALGLGVNDWLWTSPITFVSSANCGRFCGSKVDFIDINPKTGLISIEALKAKLKIAERRNCLPKVVVPVHLGGASCEMDEIYKLSKKYNFNIIEDASHALGGYYLDRPVGCCEYSDICIFSLHPVKIITTGEGGIATTNNKELFRKMMLIRSHGITKNINEFTDTPAGPWSYEQQMLGFNFRITDIQCALGLSQLNRLNQIIESRTKIQTLYKEVLLDLPVKLLSIPKGVKSSFHLAVVRLENTNINFHKYIFEYMRQHKIGVQLHYSPVHLQPYYKKLGFKTGCFPNAENYGHNAISLPLFPELKEKEIERVVHTIRKGINSYNYL